MAGEIAGGDRSTADEPPELDDTRFPPSQRFAEYLWGYEDYAITADRVAIGTLWWRYPLILDAGVAATLGFLPASFVRELDFVCSRPGPSISAATATRPRAVSSASSFSCCASRSS